MITIFACLPIYVYTYCKDLQELETDVKEFEN